MVVEHEASVMRAADQIVDLGPGHGAEGGHVVFQGSYEKILSETLIKRSEPVKIDAEPIICTLPPAEVSADPEKTPGLYLKQLREIRGMGVTLEYDSRYGRGDLTPDDFIVAVHASLTDDVLVTQRGSAR